ncbi:MAG: DUF6600 domain-containing protein [Pyrinomonadaceae bacterium]
MNQIKLWPHMTLVAILVALVAGLGTAFYFKHEQTAQAEALPDAARIQRVDGEVAINDAAYIHGQANDQTNTQWVAATANQPFSVGDRIYTRENSHASLAFTGRNFARLYPNTELEVLDLSNNRTQLAMRNGSAIFDVGYLAPGELYEVGTPYGAVDFIEPGLYDVGFDNNGNVLVSALSGVAQVVGLGGSGRISKGEFLTLAATAAAQVALASLDHRDAGYLVDDYYRYQYPNVYDGRYNDYDAYLSDPYYYDPYRRSVSYQYASYDIPGLYDLDYYGDWQDVSGYGYAWRPRVDAGWVPYQQGYWMNDYPYGPTWVSSESWGYAPYHYGRWINSGGQWFWIPDAVNTTPLYSPALVAFIPFNDSIGWVPLGPGDPYAPRYYDANWQPYYLTRTTVITTQLVNLRVPEAVTVVPLDAFGRPIDRRIIRRIDQQQLAQVRPVLDPLTLGPLRNAVVHSAWGRGKIDLPPGIAKKLNDPVFVSRAPSPPFGRDLAKALRVEQLPDRVKNQKLNVRDERRNASNQARDQVPGHAIAPADDAARKEQMTKLAAEAARGNRDARRQMQQLQQEQKKQEVEAQRSQRAQRQAQQPQGARVAEPARRQPEREIMRPQAPRARPEPRRAAPVAPRIERPQPRRPERIQQEPRKAAPQPQPQPRIRPERPQVVQPQPRPQPRQQAQPRPQAQPRQQAQPAAKREAKQQEQPAAQPQGQGKGRGKKP